MSAQYKRFLQRIGTLSVTIIGGTLGGVIVWSLVLLGKLRTRGYWRFVRTALKGRLIVTPNHPSLVEPMLLPLLLSPWGIGWPSRLFLWSMPDRNLFPSWFRWFYPVAHCVSPIREGARAQQQNAKILLQIATLLHKRGSVVIHPEGGRTSSPPRGRMAEQITMEYGQRKLRQPTTSVLRLAYASGATLLPVWVQIPAPAETTGFWSVLRWWLPSRKNSITIFFGEPYLPTGVDETAAEELGRKILRVGL